MIPAMGASRREKGTGETPHLRPDGRWRARYVGSDRRRHAVYASTKRDCAAKRDAILREIGRGVFVAGADQTVDQYLGRWLADVKRMTLRPRSLERYVGLIRNYVSPRIGGIPLRRLTPQRIASLYADVSSEGQSPASVRYLHAVLHSALDQAMRWNLIARNPVDAVEQPRKIRRELHTLSREQTQALLASVAGDDLEALYVLAIATGMRQGELLALRWKDIDWSGRRLSVRHTLTRLKGEWSLAEPKTQRSQRAIDLTDPTLATLRSHRVRQAETLLAIGHRVSDEDMVFSDAAGEPLHGRHITSRSFYPILKRAGLPQVRFHDLRHTAATLMLQLGIHPKVVSEMLGHSTITMTLDTYSHVLPTMQADAVRKLDDLLGRGAG